MYASQVSRDLAGIGLSAKGRAKCTVRLETMELATESALRVVASFNREPDPEECAKALGDLFDSKLSIIPKSFRRVDDKSGSRVVLAGFMAPVRQEIAMDELEGGSSGLKEVASGSNVYMMEGDNSIWNVDPENDRLVRTVPEDLSEIMEAASTQVKPGVASMPMVALAAVSDGIDGPDNTQYIAYINPESEEARVSFGARIDGSSVLDRATDEVVELARNMVIECRQMRGRDKMIAYSDDTLDSDAALQMDSREDLVEYYRKIYGYNPAWLDRFEDVINKGAWA